MKLEEVTMKKNGQGRDATWAVDLGTNGWSGWNREITIGGDGGWHH